LATGPVTIDTFGGEHRTGLSIVGAPVVLAFRLEKFANVDTGRILVCPVTSQMAGPRFEFRDLGKMLAKGFSRPDHVFSLEREVPDLRAKVGSL
jgi:class 3 adenylate cyclase